MGQNAATLAENAKVAAAFGLAGIAGNIRGIKGKLTAAVALGGIFPEALIKITKALQTAANWLFSSNWTNFYELLTRALALISNVAGILGAIGAAKDAYFPKKKEEPVAGSGPVANQMRRKALGESGETEVFPGRPVLGMRHQLALAF